MNDELQKLYKEYISLLEKAEGDSLGFLASHGIRTSKELVEQGKQLRARIAELEAPPHTQ